MKSILAQINKSNYRERDGNVYISKLLFAFITDITDTLTYRCIEIGGVEFIEIGSIPKDIRHDFGLFRITASSRIEQHNNKIVTEFSSNKKINIEHDVLYSIEISSKLKHEFIDYFTDSEVINEKAITLSLLNLLRYNQNSLDDMKLIHQAILKFGIKCELQIPEWSDFYKRYQWFKRITFVRGLVCPQDSPTY